VLRTVAPALAQAARTFRLLEHDDAVAVFGEHARQRRAGDAAAEDGDLHARNSSVFWNTRRELYTDRASTVEGQNRVTVETARAAGFRRRCSP